MTASRFVTGIKNDGITRSPSAQTRSMPPHLATVATSHSSSHYSQHPVELESSMIYLYVYCTATATLLRVVSEFIRKEGIQGDLQGGRRKSLLNSCENEFTQLLSTRYQHQPVHSLMIAAPPLTPPILLLNHLRIPSQFQSPTHRITLQRLSTSSIQTFPSHCYQKVPLTKAWLHNSS